MMDQGGLSIERARRKRLVKTGEERPRFGQANLPETVGNGESGV